MQFATVRKVTLMNNLTYIHYEAKRSLQKCYLPVALSTMSNRRQDIPYFLRSFARKAKTDTATEQSPLPQSTESMISVTTVPPVSYTTPHSPTRRSKFLTTAEYHHKYALRKRIKEDTYNLMKASTVGKHITSMPSKEEPMEIEPYLMDTVSSVPEAQASEEPGSSESRNAVDEEKKLRAVTISNTVDRLRQWHYTDYGKMHQKSLQHGLEFTLTSYNILAQDLLEDNSWLYHHVEPEVLEWDYRCRNLIRELRSLQSDIICLQEVQSNHFQSILKPTFETLGYECLYKKRTGSKGDGCAVLFRKTMFTLLKSRAVEFNKPGIPLLDRDNVGLIVLLRPRGLPRSYDTCLCVATTHLLFNPRRGDIKLAQLRLLLAEIDSLAFKKYCNNENTVMYHPVILCGDMNSEPFSPLYDFLCKGSLNCDSLLCGDISGQVEGANRGRVLNTEDLLHPDAAITESSQFCNLRKSTQQEKQNENREICWDEILTVEQSIQWPCEEITMPKIEDSSCQPSSSSFVQSSPSSSPTTIYHHFNFNSAYTHFCGGKHEVTTHHSKANCTVDYIFYSTQSRNHQNNNTDQQVQPEEGPLYHLGSFRLLNDKEMQEIGGLPNCYLSSDHLSLASKFLLKFS